MKFNILLIAIGAMLVTQSAHAARFRIVNKTNQKYAFQVTSKGLSKDQSIIMVNPGETSDTIGTGAHSVPIIAWGQPGKNLDFIASVDIPTVVAGGRFILLDTQGNYEYDYGIGRKGTARATPSSSSIMSPPPASASKPAPAPNPLEQQTNTMINKFQEIAGLSANDVKSKVSAQQYSQYGVSGSKAFLYLDFISNGGFGGEFATKLNALKDINTTIDAKRNDPATYKKHAKVFDYYEPTKQGYLAVHTALSQAFRNSLTKEKIQDTLEVVQEKINNNYKNRNSLFDKYLTLN